MRRAPSRCAIIVGATTAPSCRGTAWRAACVIRASSVFGLTYIPQRQVYRVDALTCRGQPVRLRVDARTGETLRVRHLDDRCGQWHDGRRR